MDRLLSAVELKFEHPEQVHAALALCRRRNVDLPDAIIGQINKTAGCRYTVTFDKRATRMDGEFKLITQPND